MAETTVGRSAVVIGVGARQGLGAAAAVLIAQKGLHVFLVGRTQTKLDAVAAEIRATGGQASTVVADCTQEESIAGLFEQVKDHGLPLRLVIYNMATPNAPIPFQQTDIEFMESRWRHIVYGGFLAGQAAIRQMLAQEEDAESEHRGSLIYTGASASLRGKPMFAAFASAKAGLRALTQSMAREFGPQGIHVAHLVIDGLVDGAIVRNVGGLLGRLVIKARGEDGVLKPDEVAKAFWHLHSQKRSAWTQEMDLRPYKEAF